MAKTRSRKYKRKRFTWIGKGAAAKVWRVEGMEGKKKLGTVIRREARRQAGGEAKAKGILMDQADIKLRLLANKIAFELFPKNVVKVTGTDVERLSLRSKEYPPDKALKRWTEGLLRKKRLEKRPDTPEMRKKINALSRELDALYEKVMERRKDPRVRRLEKEFDSAGIDFDPSPENYSLKNPKQPVCYDIDEVEVDKVREYLRAHWQDFSVKKQKKIGKLLEDYERAYEELNRAMKDWSALAYPKKT